MQDLLSPKRDTLAAGEAEVARLESLISNIKQRITLLSEEADAVRKESRAAFRAKYDAKYAKFEVVKALAGIAATYPIIIMGQWYVIQLPTQAKLSAIDKALSDAKDLAPFTSAERIVLAWLVGVGVEGNIRQLPEEVTARLTILRQMPAIMLDKISDESLSLESYVQVVLEQELKN